MPTIDELRTRIIAETNRDDMGPGGELEAVLAETIARAIEFHADEQFWFNRASAVLTTEASIASVALPGGVRIVLAVSCEGAPLRKAALDELEELAGGGRPALWAEDGATIRLWPVPDAPYSIGLSGIAELGVPAEENIWTSQAYDLIAARTRRLLCRDTLRDLDGARLAAEAEEEALARLRRETRKRGRSGLSSDLPVTAAHRMVTG